MSEKPIATRDYHLSDPALKQRADAVVLTVQRDLVQFATRGVTAATLSAFRTQIAAFADIPTDEEALGGISVATENKDDQAERLRVSIRSIRTMAQNKWTQTSAIYRTFAFDGMDSLTDDELFRLGKRVARQGTIHLAALASEGLTAAVIANLVAINTAFDTAIDAKIDAENQRDILKQERIDKGNAVYKELIRLCNTGKDLFAATDEARYNDYVVTESSTPPPPPPTEG